MGDSGRRIDCGEGGSSDVGEGGRRDDQQCEREGRTEERQW